MIRKAKSHLSDENGVQLVEYVAVFPFVLLAAMIAFQFMVGAYTVVVAAAAAREGARAAAVHENAYVAAANASVGFQRQVFVTGAGNGVRCTVKLKVPMFPLWPGEVWATGNTTMRLER